MIKKYGEYNIGDVVRITNRGGLYTTYWYAMKYFNVTNISDNQYDYCLSVCVPEDFDKYNWVIVNKAIHYNAKLHGDNVYEYDIVYCVENHRKERLITSSHYFTLRPNVKTSYTEKLKKQNEFFRPIYLGV